MKQSHVNEKERRKHKCIRFCLNSGTARSLMSFAVFTCSLLRELSVIVRKLSQKAMEKLYFSFASYCSGSVTSKVSNSPVSTPQGQHRLKPTGVHQATMHACVCNYKYQGGQEEEGKVQTNPESSLTVKLIDKPLPATHT